jgi:hypothetical protein
MTQVARWRKYWNPNFLVEAKLKEKTPDLLGKYE